MGIDARKNLDRRNHSRRDCELTLTSRVGVERATVSASDISTTGARILMPAEYSKVKEIVLSAPGPRAAHPIRAQIIWVRPQADGLVLAGVRFLEKPSRLQSSWVAAHLGLRASQAAQECDQVVSLRAPGWLTLEPARLRLLEPDGATLECAKLLHLDAKFCLYLPYAEGEKQLPLNCQVVHRLKQVGHWIFTAQFALSEKARERPILQRILRDMAKAE